MIRRHAPRGRGGRLVPALTAAALVLGGCSSAIVELEYGEVADVPRNPPEQTFVYDAAGNELAVLRRVFRERVTLDEVAPDLLDAVIAAEDRRFYAHAGVDARALVRAALRNAAAGDVQEGGSTITQQLVKNLYMPEAPRTPETKLEEALIARELEREHDKDWILAEYLNTVYFGNGAYGIKAAAWTYFRKEPADLDIAEAALLAGIIRAPESLDPERDVEATIDRRNDVIDAMVDMGTLAPAQADQARREPIDVRARPPTPETTEPHWVNTVVRQLLDDPSFAGTEQERATRLYGGGLRIHTTLRPDLQRIAGEVMATLDRPDDPDASVALIDPATGQLVAAASSVPFDELQYDLATQGRRQPGSVFKTFVLAAALSSGWRPDDTIDGSPGTFQTRSGPWRVRNYGGARYGRMSLARATQQSVNGAYARLILDVGPARVAALAKAMGVRSPVEDRATIALGGMADCCTALDIAAGMATLANLGARIPTTVIDRIEDADGKVVWRPDTAPRRVLDPGIAWLTLQQLEQVVQRGTGVRARLPGWAVAGKTGTVTDAVDAWFAGTTPTLTGAVWVGHHEARIPMRGIRGLREVTGGTLPAQLWRQIFAAALAGEEPVTAFTLPDSEYREVEVDPETGLLAAPWCAGEPTEMPRVLVPDRTCPSPQPEPVAEPTSDAEPTDQGTATPSECPTETETTGPAPAPSVRPEDCDPPSPTPPPGPDGSSTEPP